MKQNKSVYDLLNWQLRRFVQREDNSADNPAVGIFHWCLNHMIK